MNDLRLASACELFPIVYVDCECVGDDSSVVIVVRGGPEEIMTTSWIQIISVGSKREGTYICVAENAEGKTQRAARLTLKR